MARSNIASELNTDALTPLALEMVRALAPKALAKAEKRTRIVDMTDPYGATDWTPDEIRAAGFREQQHLDPLSKSIINLLNSGSKIERLAFEADPAQTNQYYSLYRTKQKLLPDHILKRIAIQDDLVASITNTRANQVSAFGRPQPDRFSTGFKIEPEPGALEKMSEDERLALQKRIGAAAKVLTTCGATNGWKDQEQLTLSQCLYMTARNAVTVGRLAMEIIHVVDQASKKKKFHSFRPIDAGTIYRAAPQKAAADQVRANAYDLLSKLKGERLEPERYQNDEYAWVQVVEGRPVQAFTNEECVVHNFYPVADIELGGYPLTPLDTVIAAVTTHINITNHNKLYFQSGRAARGMIVIQSDDVDQNLLGQIKQAFNASINSVSNAFRMPIFGVAKDDVVSWQPIDNSSRDMEFSYLSDNNARVILSAYQMSPEELPGYSHLSRGTNNQALSESNNEYKLEAHRDVGIRPLVAQFQNFLNARILPLIDEDLAKICSIKLVGLDTETAEKESIRIQQDMGIHMVYDEVLEKVEKEPVGARWGGQIPLNPAFQAILDKYFTVGSICEHFLGMKGAEQDIKLAYVRDEFWFEWQQLLLQLQQAQQAPPPGQPGSDGSGAGAQPQGQRSEGSGAPGEGQQGAAGDQPQGQDQQPQEQGQDLTSSLDQLLGTLGKSERQLPASRRQLLLHQRRTVKAALDAWEAETPKAIEEILGVAERFAPKG